MKDASTSLQKVTRPASSIKIAIATRDFRTRVSDSLHPGDMRFTLGGSVRRNWKCGTPAESVCFILDRPPRPRLRRAIFTPRRGEQSDPKREASIDTTNRETIGDARMSGGVLFRLA
jgi:hypothetical protein